MENLLFVLLALALVLLNGFFVAAEFAIVKLRLTQAEELAAEKGLAGRILRSVRLHLDAYLSACQLGITLASLALGWIGEPAFAHLMEPLLLAIGVGSQEVVHAVSFAVAFAVISFLHIVVGELAPKSLAIRRAEGVSLWTAPPLFLFYWLMYPFIWLLNGSANWLLKGMGVTMSGVVEDPHSPAELKQMLVASHRHGELAQPAAEILAKTLEVSEMVVGDLTRPANDLVSLNLRHSIEENLSIVDEHRYSRYPVFEGGQENVVGLVHVKDLYAVLRKSPEAIDLRKVAREIPIVHRRTSVLSVLRRLRRGQPHLALVTDDRGSIAGFITLDHLLAALVGGIRDEFHRTHRGWSRDRDGSYVVSGALPVRELQRLMQVSIADAGVNSAGGLVMSQLDGIPKVGQRATFEGFSLEVLEMRGPRVHKLRAVPKSALSDAVRSG